VVFLYLNCEAPDGLNEHFRILQKGPDSRSMVELTRRKLRGLYEFAAMRESCEALTSASGQSV
jgi:hypothetical protein